MLFKEGVSKVIYLSYIQYLAPIYPISNFICDRYGGTLQTNVCLEELPAISLEEAVHRTVYHNSAEDVPLTESLMVAVEDDIIGRGASIAYHDCLKQLADYLILPDSMCKAKDPQTKKKCGSERPASKPGAQLPSLNG